MNTEITTERNTIHTEREIQKNRASSHSQYKKKYENIIRNREIEQQRIEKYRNRETQK
jgi:hypothetical protein